MKPRSRSVGKQLLHAALVALFGGADEVVVGEPELVPQAAELAGDGGGELRRRAAGLLGGALDLLAVLVGAGEEPGVDAQRPFAPRDGVADDGRVGVAQVRPRIHVVDGRGQVIAGWTGAELVIGGSIAFNSRREVGVEAIISS